MKILNEEWNADSFSSSSDLDVDVAEVLDTDEPLVRSNCFGTQEELVFTTIVAENDANMFNNMEDEEQKEMGEHVLLTHQPSGGQDFGLRADDEMSFVYEGLNENLTPSVISTTQVDKPETSTLALKSGTPIERATGRDSFHDEDSRISLVSEVESNENMSGIGHLNNSVVVLDNEKCKIEENMKHIGNVSTTTFDGAIALPVVGTTTSLITNRNDSAFSEPILSQSNNVMEGYDMKETDPQGDTNKSLVTERMTVVSYTSARDIENLGTKVSNTKVIDWGSGSTSVADRNTSTLDYSQPLGKSNSITDTVEESQPSKLTLNGLKFCSPSNLTHAPSLDSNVSQIDCDKLFALLENAMTWGNVSDGQDVLVLIGNSGAGKTTTLLHMAGVKFDEVEIDGHLHLEPTHFPNDDLRKFKLGYGASSITDTVQGFMVKSEGQKHATFICDGPGLNDTRGLEMEVAYKIGLLNAIRRAKSVKPVVVISVDSFRGRCESLSTMLDEISRMTAGLDYTAFSYVFTKADGKRWESRISKILGGLRKTVIERDRVLHASLLDDMIQKTSPYAVLVDPVDDDGATTLRALLSDKCIVDTQSFFRWCLSESTANALRVHLQKQIREISYYLDCENYEAAQKILKVLFHFETILPEVAALFAQQGRTLGLQYAAICKREIEEGLAQISTLRINDFETIVSITKSFKKQLYLLSQSESFCALCGASKEYRVTAVVEMLRPLLQETVLEAYVASPDDSAEVLDLFFSKQCAFSWHLTCLYRLKDALAGYSSYDDALRSYSESLNRLTILLNHIFLHSTDLLRSVHQIDCFEKHLSFCLQVQKDIDSGRYIDECEDWSWVSERIKQMIFDLNTVAADHAAIISDALLNFNNCSAGETHWTSASFLDLKVNEILLSREFIFAIVDKKALISNTTLRCVEIIKLVESFDKHVAVYLNQVASSAKIVANHYIHDGHEICSIEARKQEAKMMIDKLAQSCLVCKSFRSSLKFEQVTIDESWQGMIRVIEFLNIYCNGLDENAIALVKGAKGAADASSDFLSKLKSGRRPIWNMLDELLQAENWDCWVSFLPEEECTTSRILGFIQSFTSSRPTLNTLNSTLTKISVVMHSYIMNAFTHVSDPVVSIQSSAFCNEAEALSLLNNLSTEVLLCFEIFKIGSNSRFLARIRNIGDAAEFDKANVKAQQALEQRFCRLSKFPEELLQNGKFELLGDVLHLWKNPSCPDFWTQVRAFSLSVKSSASCVGEAAHLHQMVKQIDSCQTYDALCRMSSKAYCKFEKELEETSFDKVLKFSSEIERTLFFSHVECLMERASNTQFLINHIGNKGGESVKSISQRFRQKILDEIELIGTKLFNLLSAFPNNKDEFDLINVLIANLKSIQTAFKSCEHKYSTKAEQFIFQANKRAFEKLDDTRSLTWNDTVHCVCELLILKKASRDITFWSKAINCYIDEQLCTFAQRSENPSRCIMNLSILLRNEDGERAPLALQILAEHRCFDGAMNALFNEATSRQGIDYVLQKMDPIPTDSLHMKEIYNMYEKSYKEIVQEGLLRQRKSGDDAFNRYLSEIVCDAKKIAIDFSLDYESQVILLTSNVFAFWSLKRSNGFVSIAETKEQSMPYLLQPHAAQVIAVWLLLNCKEKTYQHLRNQMVEIKTGEGKSVILAVIAIILALFNWHVDCVCYSEYLSTRDFKSFEDLFIAFDVCNSIWYGTIKNLSFSILKDYRVYAQMSLQNENNLRCTNCPTQRPRVLLIDEVDIFFKEDVFGETTRPAVVWQSDALTQYFLYLYDNKASLDSSRSKSLRDKVVSSLLLLWRPVINSMLVKAHHQANNNFTSDYAIRHRRIAYKYLDGYTTSTSYGLSTIFTYIKEYRAGRLTENEMKAGLELVIAVGQLSHAEFPFDYEVILGVSGTLKGLGVSELQILRSRYGIEKYSFIPSVFGDNKLKFAADSPHDFFLCSDSSDYYLKLTNEIRNRRCARSGTKDVKRAVIVFFESKKAIETFYNSSYMEQLRVNTQTVTEHVPLEEKDALFQKATEQGAISLMIREYGRGTDFKCFDSRMLQEGGVHVIQSFFSRDVSEEVQIKGRCARQGEDGSFCMVLNFEPLSRDFGLTRDELHVMQSQQKLYSYLAVKRDNHFDKILETLTSKVNAAEELHYRTLACRDAINVDNPSEESVQNLLRFISELNNCEKYSVGSNSNLKEHMLNQRVAKLEARTAQDRERRLIAQAAITK